MAHVQLMPDHLSNKIAAGEVVERPASVVKELAENSIDAGASWVTIELMEAGLQKIRITDNGAGMEEEDCERAFYRHATSEISSENDLFHVRTLGFRGEALASIAAVSRLRVQTSTGDQAGTKLDLEGGKLMNKSKSDARQGTDITVEELFFNTPARLKYMKTIHTELGHITDVLNRMALAHPEIKFKCTHNDKEIFQTNGRGDLLQVIAKIYGVNVARKMIPIQADTLDFKVTGYIAKPEVYRASRSYMSTIINGRFIRSIPLNKAVLQGYHTLLPIGKSPIVVLNIEMDPILVDVNVHPAKLEVRFSKEKELFEALQESITKAFREQRLIPEVQHANPKPEKKEKSTQGAFDFYTEQKSAAQNAGRLSMDSITDENSKRKDAEEAASFSARQDTLVKEEVPVFEAEESSVNEEQDREDISLTEEKAPSRVPAMHPVGQVHGTYIIAQNEDGMYIVDQHAAQERIKYEFFRDKLAEVDHEVQELLVPLTFDFSKQESLKIEEYKEELEKVGLFFETFGEQSYIIRSHPQWFPKGFEEEVIHEIIDQLMNEDRINVLKLREEAAILMSCKRSIKANHYLDHTGMSRLLEDLRTSTDPFTCPHGRPIIVHFSEYEMEKMFKRVM
ncbi:DNA mismatch repair protein MutL [Halobacillus halophilus]|uniref:DNA mismatch repair protein MutL n=1 Tax=Halobacillus halophilus (strain ATCC 35676 / DSM 2266 / JCM 20832 / KCTC 3685 / LMG 17431 / NBRC 102448 / NCIMB 2269) TaxID=866895 RepID=I0JMU7_HALH3|nr:DNA mismatch repair endonuclease MutL [Halobacillus halophilus]ASF39543.1 DNA mismatch repair protein MutL [Halobacillus halophilus]CCG45467.1 DNA mismatch repair protein MutL [Halobacillus halophilus DSM 2266]